MPEGDLLALQSLLRRILGEPNNLQQNLRDAAACERRQPPWAGLHAGRGCGVGRQAGAAARWRHASASTL